MSENNALHMRFAFWYILFAVSCKTTTSNDKIIGFVENDNARRLSFLSLYLNLKAVATATASGQSSHVRKLNKLEKLQSTKPFFK